MDEKVKEIEGRLKCCIVTDSDGKQETFLISKEDVKYLLSRIKELEDTSKGLCEKIDWYCKRIKELEDCIAKLLIEKVDVKVYKP